MNSAASTPQPEEGHTITTTAAAAAEAQTQPQRVIPTLPGLSPLSAAQRPPTSRVRFSVVLRYCFGSVFVDGFGVFV